MEYVDALQRGRSEYIDPASGFAVVTETGHLERGWCCGSGCRHCPWQGDPDKAPKQSGAPDGRHAPPA